MMVRFNAKMVDDLTAQQNGSASARALFSARVMEAQSEPRPGRLNVKFRDDAGDDYSYRTYAWSDLEVVE